MARQVAKRLGHDHSVTAEDIRQTFSTFDGRFSRQNISNEPPSNAPAAQFDEALISLHLGISKFLTADHPIWADSVNSASFLASVDELTAAIGFYTPMAANKGVRGCLRRADELEKQAMFRLAAEFRVLMERGGEALDSDGKLGFEFDEEDEIDENDEIPIAHPVTDFDIIIDALPSGTINDVRGIVERMVAAGYGKECCHVYSSCRRDFLEESLSRLRLQKLSNEEVQSMNWSDLDEEVERWSKGATLALRVLFPSERHLCNRVFAGVKFSSIAELAFVEVCRGTTIQILNFADAVGNRSKAPERLFKVLDLFETLRDLMPEFEAQFSDQYSAALRNEAVVVLKRLGEGIRGIFMELKNSIRRDPARTPIPGGGVHPITRYVMNYLLAAFRSRETLEQVFEDSAIEHRRSDEGAFPASLAVQVKWIMELLERNLEAKSMLYQVPALWSLFMMNNGVYIVQKAKGNELGYILGDEWIRKQSAKVQQYLVHYHRSSWGKVLITLKLETGTVTDASLMEKLKQFNILFEEIVKAQSSWVFLDEQFQNDLKATVVDSYRIFIGNFMSTQANKVIRYGVGDVEAMMNQLFKGGQSRGSGRK